MKYLLVSGTQLSPSHPFPYLFLTPILWADGFSLVLQMYSLRVREISCRARTSDLDLSDFNVPVLSSSLSCQSNRTHDGLTRMSQGTEGASCLHWMRWVGWQVAGKAFLRFWEPLTDFSSWLSISWISHPCGSGSKFTPSLSVPRCWFQHL